MRRFILLSTIVGLFLSMVTTMAVAQSATPVASDPTPTTTEVMTGTSTDAPKVVEIATPAVESEQPVGRSSAPESSIQAANDPPLKIDGVASNRIVPFGHTVVVVTDPRAILSMYSDAICESAETPVDTGFEMAAGSEPTVSFQARWPNNPGAAPSPCLSVKWSVPPTAAPGLTIDGVAANTVVPLVTWIDVESVTGAHLSYYDGADCTLDEEVTDVSASSFSWGTQYTMSFQSEWDYFPNLPKSPCLSATWGSPQPSAAPILTIDGVAEGKTVPVNTWILVVTDPEANVTDYAGADCEGQGYENGSTINTASHIEQAGSYRADWEDDRLAPASPCLTVWWVDAPIVAPNLTLNDVEGDATVEVNETITFVTDANAHLDIFATLDCTGTSTSEVSSGFAPTFSEPTHLSAKAVSNVSSDLVSACYVAEWVAPTATPTQPATPTDTATPTVTATPTQPTATPTETPAPQPKQTSIRVEMWDGSSIEGASWSLVAPVASQVAATKCLTGLFEPDNTAVLTDIPAGEYRFVVAPEGVDSQEFAIVISEDSEEIVLQFVQPVTPEPEVSPAVTQVPADPEPTVSSVTGLPSTGSGSGTTPTIMSLAGLLVAVMFALMIGSRRRNA